MFTVKKHLTFAAAHRLDLPYKSKCTNLHGHEWELTVYLRASELDSNGMVMDFSEIKHRISGILDHSYLNDVLPFNPTAENIARWVSDQLTDNRVVCYMVELMESRNNTVIYTRD